MVSERDASTPASRFIYSEHGFVLDETEPADLWRIKHPVSSQAHGDLAGFARPRAACRNRDEVTLPVCRAARWCCQIAILDLQSDYRAEPFQIAVHSLMPAGFAKRPAIAEAKIGINTCHHAPP